MTRLMTATALALVLGCGAALAQSQSSGQTNQTTGASRTQQMGQNINDCWSQAKDQTNAQGMFQRLDSDSDGKLSEAELRACQASGGNAPQFALVDANNDGNVSRDEFAAAARQQQSSVSGQSSQSTAMTGNTGSSAAGSTRSTTGTASGSNDSAANQTTTTTTTGGGTAGAQTSAQAQTGTGATGTLGTTSPMPATERWYGQLSAQEVIGRDVVNLNGDDVGEIEDIVANPQTKQLSAVISVGGFLGMGQKQVLIPFDRLRLGDNDVILMSQQDEEQLEAMPTYREGADYRRIEGNQRLGEWSE